MKTFVFEANNAAETGHPHEVPYDEKKRRCVECKKPLSGYNASNRCYSHGVTEETIISNPIRRVSIEKRMKEKKVLLWMQTY